MTRHCLISDRRLKEIISKIPTTKNTMEDVVLYCGTVTRVEVIDENGRVYVNNNTQLLEMQLQDDRRTLKIFVRNS